MQVVTDATTTDGFQTVCMCLKLKDETGAVSRLSLGEVLSESGTAEGEVRALDDHMRSRLRVWLILVFFLFPVGRHRLKWIQNSRSSEGTRRQRRKP